MKNLDVAEMVYKRIAKEQLTSSQKVFIKKKNIIRDIPIFVISTEGLQDICDSVNYVIHLDLLGLMK